MAHGSDAGARLRGLGAAIRGHREAAGVTQAELGERLGEVTGEPVPQTTVSRWESGSVDLGYEQVRAIERALGLDAGAIAITAGYVAPQTVTGGGFRTMYVGTVEQAVEAIECAEALQLGIRVSNRWRVHADGSESEEWVVTLIDDAPFLEQ
jgi:transcriptional regulator with XRE-family HTH domain